MCNDLVSLSEPRFNASDGYFEGFSSGQRALLGLLASNGKDWFKIARNRAFGHADVRIGGFKQE